MSTLGANLKLTIEYFSVSLAVRFIVGDLSSWKMNPAVLPLRTGGVQSVK